MPVIPGVKSEKEKFAGADYTTTVEGFIPTTGWGIQGGTSHSLGQNFSREEMFDISVENPTDPGSKLFVWQNSWGLSTRTIGVMVMTHGDNQGLVLPPRVASVQAIVVPCGIGAKTNKGEIYEACEKLAKELKREGVRAKADLREGYTPGYKFNDWEQKVCSLILLFHVTNIEAGCSTSIGNRPSRPRQIASPLSPSRHRSQIPHPTLIHSALRQIPP